MFEKNVHLFKESFLSSHLIKISGDFQNGWRERLLKRVNDVEYHWLNLNIVRVHILFTLGFLTHAG